MQQTIKFQVSVIIPVFNAERFLRESVESALRQPEVGEVVLVDDGSTDDSLSLCESLKKADPEKIAVVWHDGHANLGPGPSRNLGLRMARCPFVAFLDADDWYIDGCFSFDKGAFEANPELGFVRHSLQNGFNPNDSTQSWFVKYNGSAQKAEAKYHSFVGPEVTPSTYFENLYPMGNLGPGVAGTITVRKSSALAVGGFPKRDWGEDATFHAKLALLASVALAPNDPSMAIRRIHEANLTRTNADKMAHRIKSVDEMLLDVGLFMKGHGQTPRRILALHRGWLRFASRIPPRMVPKLLQSRIRDLLLPKVFFAYVRFVLCLAFAKARRIFSAIRRSRHRNS